MTMIMEKATYVAKNGTEFTFKYNEGRRQVEVYISETLHMTIAEVEPENATQEMNHFMEVWNQANPKN